MLTNNEIGKLAGFMASHDAYPFILQAEWFVVVVNKKKNQYFLKVEDYTGRVLFTAEDRNVSLKIREYYKNQSECDLVETALRGILC